MDESNQSSLVGLHDNRVLGRTESERRTSKSAKAGNNFFSDGLQPADPQSNDPSSLTRGHHLQLRHRHPFFDREPSEVNLLLGRVYLNFSFSTS